MEDIVRINGLQKLYDNGFEALSGIDLTIRKGEILALLGPNGAGKTTLISTICGITRPSAGSVTVGGHDIQEDYRRARAMIGLVPQETYVESFETVIKTIRFSRGLFGKKPDEPLIERILKSLTLWDKKDNRIMELSGGMKRRLLIAKALAHEPSVLFLDEPTAGVDVELRKDMWEVVRGLKAEGVTIILTTHYIEEAEAMADRIGIINKGQILLLEDKDALMKRLGQKTLRVELSEPVTTLPDSLAKYGLEADGTHLTYRYDTRGDKTGITGLLADIRSAGLHMTDLQTRQSSLEEIFVSLVKENA